MIKLKQLITERMSASEVGDILSKAYITIFDIDDVHVSRATYTGAPAFTHAWANIRIKLKYKFNEYLVVNRLVYYKFPPQEKDKLNSAEWDHMIKVADKMPSLPLTRDVIVKKNHLIRYGAGVYTGGTADNPTDDTLHMDLIGEVFEATTMGELVTKVKDIIDKHNSGSSDDRDIAPTPVEPEFAIK